MLGNFYDILLSADFFSNQLFQNKEYHHCQTFCQGYKQTTLVGKKKKHTKTQKADITHPVQKFLTVFHKQEGQVTLNGSPELCLNLTYRYLLKAGHVPGNTWSGAIFGPRGII